MRIIVTGANGYIGMHVVKELIDKKHEVIALDLNFDNISNLKCKKIKCNLFKTEKLIDIVGIPDVLIHLAWRDGFNLNSYNHILDVSSHFRFIKNFIDCGLKHIAILGSMHEIGFYEGEVDDDVTLNPTNLYGISKKLLKEGIDRYSRQNNVIYQWVRGYYLTGDDQFNNSIFNKILYAEMQGKETFPFTTGCNKFDFIDINIFSKNLVSIIEQKKINGVINNCSGIPISLSEKVEEFLKINNLNIKLQYGVYPERDDESKGIWGKTEKLNRIIDQNK